MSRYIDADNLKERIPKDIHADVFENCSNCELLDCEQVKELIDLQPTADVVEVVRCSECKYNISNPRRFIDDDIIMCYSWCEHLKEVNGFCSYGKRENFTGGGL